MGKLLTLSLRCHGVWCNLLTAIGSILSFKSAFVGGVGKENAITFFFSLRRRRVGVGGVGLVIVASRGGGGGGGGGRGGGATPAPERGERSGVTERSSPRPRLSSSGSTLATR